MVLTPALRSFFVRPGAQRSPSHSPPSHSHRRPAHGTASSAASRREEAGREEVTLYCQAQPGFAQRLMGAQTAYDILTHGFENKRYRFHAPSNGWIAGAEWIEREAVFLTDRPVDPAGIRGEQIEVVVGLTARELRQYEMVPAEATRRDYTGETYRRDREFLVPAGLLNVWGKARQLTPEEAFVQCSFRIAEAEGRARQRARQAVA